MSRNAIAAMAVIFVSGFAGCAATARADDVATEAPRAMRSHPSPTAPVLGSVAAATVIASALYISAARRRALRNASPG